jgi:hypothetical protein
MLNNQGAISAVFSLLLLIIITCIAGILLYNFTIGMIENTTSSSTTLFSLQIENVSINNTCMTIHVGNHLDHDVTVRTVYINDKQYDILLSADNDAVIPSASTDKVYVPGNYISGGSFNIKLVLTSGYTILTIARY